MQTSPISNPVNSLSTPSPAAGRNESNTSGTSFDQVLSQEVAERSTPPTTPAGKTADNASRSAPSSTTASSSKQTEAKPAKGKVQDDDTASDGEDTEVTAQLPQDILALVANLVQMSQAAQGKEGDQAAAETSDLAAQDTLAAADPALAATIMAGLAPAAGQVATQVNAATQAPTDLVQRKSSAAINMATDIVAAASPQLETEVASGVEALSLTPFAELAAAGPDVQNGTAALPSSSSASDFATMMKESLSVASSMQPAQSIQQVATNMGLAQVTSTSDKLTPAVGSPAWDQALGQKVIWMVAGEQQSASLTLNPPDLGPLQVVLNVSNSQANATFIAAQPEVRQALEAALPRLREMLGEAGIQLGQASVNSGSPNQQGNTDQQNTPSSPYLVRGENFHEAPVQVGRIPVTSSGQGLVDTFV